MHKYQPRLHIVICDENMVKLDEETRIDSLTTELVREFVFDETQFMAVTAYQNHRVSSTKKMNFAKFISKKLHLLKFKY